MTRCVTTIAAVTLTQPTTGPDADSTATMVATIAPGPASRGVPRGTSAALVATESGSGCSSALSVSSSSATSSNNSPPEICSAGTVMPKNRRM